MKYDTNPLDPEFPEKVRETETKVLPKSEKKTREYADSFETEEQTQRFNQANFASYAPPPETGQTPASFQTTPLNQPAQDTSPSRESV